MKTSEILTLILGLVILTISVLTTLGVKPQQEIQQEELIIGTWVPKGSPQNSLVFTSDHIAKKYINDNELFKMYHWSITKGETPSGLTIPYLTLTNVNNSDDIYEYEIDTLTQKRLILVYNTGIGLSRSVYLRQ